MASNHAAVSRTIRQFIDRTLTPEAAAKRFAATARGYRDELIHSGAAPEQYRTFVDGREGAVEETTRPGGATVYRFNQIGALVRRTLDELRRASPRKSGDFEDAWVVSVNGLPWMRDYDDIPADADVVIVNIAPYSRKIEVGAMKISVPAHPIERARQRLLRAFPSVFFAKTFVTLPASFGSARFATPYILKGQYHDPAFAAARRQRAFVNGTMFYKAGRSQERGQQLTYPALSIEVVKR